MTLHTVAAAGHSTGTVDTVDTVATVATVVAATSVMADSVTDMAMMVDSVDMVDTEGDSEGDSEGDTVIKGLICKLFFSTKTENTTRIHVYKKVSESMFFIKTSAHTSAEPKVNSAAHVDGVMCNVSLCVSPSASLGIPHV